LDFPPHWGAGAGFANCFLIYSSLCFTILFSCPVTLLWFSVLFLSLALLYVISSLLFRLLFTESSGENFYYSTILTEKSVNSILTNSHWFQNK
jgi:hypothetical protein